jgi:predicted SAM-dependent methyltransferase
MLKKTLIWCSKNIFFGLPLKFYEKFTFKSYESKSEEQIKNYILSHKIRKLQIGAGLNDLSDWLNTDIREHNHTVYLDAAKRFPIEDNTFDYVFSEHMIEHIDYNDGLFMLKECFRILKNNGKIRITTPNLKFLVELYQENKTPTQIEYIKWSYNNFCDFNNGKESDSFVINNFFYNPNWGHKFIFDFQTLKIILENAGFRNVELVETNTSKDSHLHNVEGHGNPDNKHNESIPREFNLLESITVEATCFKE